MSEYKSILWLESAEVLAAIDASIFGFGSPHMSVLMRNFKVQNRAGKEESHGPVSSFFFGKARRPEKRGVRGGERQSPLIYSSIAIFVSPALAHSMPSSHGYSFSSNNLKLMYLSSPSHSALLTAFS
jgi:hypothetical protein